MEPREDAIAWSCRGSSRPMARIAGRRHLRMVWSDAEQRAGMLCLYESILFYCIANNKVANNKVILVKERVGPVQACAFVI